MSGRRQKELRARFLRLYGRVPYRGAEWRAVKKVHLRLARSGLRP